MILADYMMIYQHHRKTQPVFELKSVLLAKLWLLV